jgi:hypothetical protein
MIGMGIGALWLLWIFICLLQLEYGVTIRIVIIDSFWIVLLGMTIKICTFEDAEYMTVRTEDKTFYTEENFRDSLSRRGWTLLRECWWLQNCWYGDTLDDLRPGAIY